MNSQSSANPQQPPQPGNPLAQSYAAWAEKTPFLTRTLTITAVVLYILSFFISLDLYFGNIPKYTLFRFEIYRLILSPLVGNSILTLLLGLFMFVPSGSRFENSIGSAAFGALLLTIDVAVNLLFLLTCLLFWSAGIDSAMSWVCADIWIWVFGLMSIECFRVSLSLSLLRTRFISLAGNSHSRF
jgi:membrane associated rhomboid family serine protease